MAVASESSRNTPKTISVSLGESEGGDVSNIGLDAAPADDGCSSKVDTPLQDDESQSASAIEQRATVTSAQDNVSIENHLQVAVKSAKCCRPAIQALHQPRRMNENDAIAGASGATTKKQYVNYRKFDHLVLDVVLGQFPLR